MATSHYSVKPPLGPRPRYVTDWYRYVELCTAIQLAYDATSTIHVEWIEEYNELIARNPDWKNNK